MTRLQQAHEWFWAIVGGAFFGAVVYFACSGAL